MSDPATQKRLLDNGLSLQSARRAIDCLRKSGENLSSAHLVLNQGDKSTAVLTEGLASLVAQQGYASDWSALFAGMVIAMLPVLVVYLVFQRRVREGFVAGALK